MSVIQFSGQPHQTPIILWAEGCFGQAASKTATGVIRYGQWPIVAVIDSQLTGKTVADVLPQLGCAAPIVASLEEALKHTPAAKALMIGTAPPGGQLPQVGYACVEAALGHGLSVISGLHHFLHQDPHLATLATANNAQLWDVRHWDRQNLITHQHPRPAGKKVITFVGSDCAIGKMVSALELHKAAQADGQRSAFVATGQTGIMIDGQGIPLDSLVADFAAGTMEWAIEQRLPEADWLWVEGQGSLLHPAYSGVTMSLIHGSCPDGLILCHKADSTHIRNYTVPIPEMTKLIKVYEHATHWAKPAGSPRANVLGIAVNTSMLSPEAAKAYTADITTQTGLPCADPIRDGVASLWQAVKARLL
jgi:uncharacterized NAD-dependent epimerase/dehydratase family protein